MRASDADRDRYAAVLREALAEGRLTADEHSDRIDAVYSARTMGELEPLVRDLPGAHHGPAPRISLEKEPLPPRAPGGESAPAGSFSPQMVGIFGGVERKGRWRVPEKLDGFAMFGGFDLDFTDAVFEHREVTINIVAIFGGAEIKVPENVTLRGGGGIGIFGGFDIKEHEAPDPDAPIVTVTGFALFGGVSAKPKKGKRLKDLRGGDRRELMREQMREHRELMREQHELMREQMRHHRDRRRRDRY